MTDRAIDRGGAPGDQDPVPGTQGPGVTETFLITAP
jgi:hypothetical protein